MTLRERNSCKIEILVNSRKLPMLRFTQMAGGTSYFIDKNR